MQTKEFSTHDYETHLARLGPARAAIVKHAGAAYVDRDGVRWVAPGTIRRDVPLVVKSTPRPPSPAPAPPPAAKDDDLLAELRGKSGTPDDLDRYVASLPESRPIAPSKAVVADDTSDLLAELTGGSR